MASDTNERVSVWSTIRTVLINDMKLKSNKTVKSFEECFRKFTCSFPLSAANEIDPVSRKPAIYISINTDTVYVPVGEPVELELPQWSLLRSVNFMGLPVFDYDPIRKNGWYRF